MIDWQPLKIGDLGRVVTGKTPPTESTEYYDGDELFVSPKDLTWNSYYVDSTATRISEKALDKFKRQVIPRDAVMFTSLSFAFGKMGIASRSCITNQQINSIIVHDTHCSRFVYYLLRAYEPHIFAYNSGIDTPIVPKSVFERIPVLLPGKAEQEKIASLLCSYDDLIANNQRRIALLESMAEEIYREWFVRMRAPVSDECESSGQAGLTSLDELGTFLNGYAFDPTELHEEGLPIIKIRELNAGVCADTPRNTGDKIAEKYNFGDGDIVFSWSASLVVQIWHQGPALLNQHLFKVTPAKDVSREFLYFSIKFAIPIFESLTTGATMQHIKRKELRFVKVRVPGPQGMKAFDNLVSPLMEQALRLKQIIVRLKSQRDALLPRLISGKLRVDDLDIQFPPSMQPLPAEAVPREAIAR